MELVVVAKTHQVLQQALLIDGRTGIADLHAAPIGLARHQAVALEQITDQYLAYRPFFSHGGQQIGRGLVAGAFHIQPVQVQTVEFKDRLAVKEFRGRQFDANRGQHHRTAPHRLIHVMSQAGQNGGGIVKAGIVKTVQIELEGLALNDVVALAGHHEMRQRHLGLAARVEPAQLERRPQVGTKKRC